MHVTGRTSDGRTIDETVPDSTGQVSTDTITIWSANPLFETAVPGVLAVQGDAGAPGFDPDTPIRIEHTVTTSEIPDTDRAYLPYASVGCDLVTRTDQRFAAAAQVQSFSNPMSITVPPPDRYAPSSANVFAVNAPFGLRSAGVYEAALEIETMVGADPNMPVLQRNLVLSQLRSVRGLIGARNFAGASRTAANTVPLVPSSQAVIRVSLTSLAMRLAALP